MKLKKPSQKRLGTKIAISFGLVTLILIGTIAFTLYKINQTNKIAERLYSQTTPQMSTAMTMTKGLFVLVAYERDWLITKNTKYQTLRDNTWKKNIFPHLQSLIKNKPENLLSSNLSKLEFNLKSLYTSIKKLDEIDDQTTDEKLKYFYDEIYPLANNAESMLELFIREQQSALFSGLQFVKKQIINILIIDAGFLLLGIILCILLGIVLTNLVTKPVKKLVHMTDEIAKGNLDQHINLTEAEEFEHLSYSINNVVQTLNDIANVTVKMSQGDYSHHVNVKSKHDKLAISTNLMLDNFNAIVKQANAIAAGDYSSEIKPRSKQDTLGEALQHMTATLRKNKEDNDEQNWLKDGLAQFANIISEARHIKKLCNDSISAACRYVEAGMGAVYLLDQDKEKLNLQGSYAFVDRDHLANTYEIGQGLIGQVAYENKPILLRTPSDKEHKIDTGLTKKEACVIYAFPLIYEQKLIGVCELAWLDEPQSLVYQYLDSLMPILSSHIQATQQQTITEKLLHEQKLFAEKLSTQQEELKATNEELEHQAQILKASEEELRVKDEEQRKINKQLEERTKELELQKEKMEEANKALKNAKIELENKAEELARASKYKSEFLANMSHELRTPLNSLLILAKIFADNADNSLNEEQVESAKIMLKSGQDLLMLINDILDLAKVEAGKIEVNLSEMNLHNMTENLSSIFSIVAKDKGIDFITEISDDTPELIITDEQRVTQIIRNLLSNAMKFTSEGYVKLSIYKPQQGDEINDSDFDVSQFIAISVSDTGIGISTEKQKLVFDSFQQADGTTSRKYGGTGLGLSISKEFTKLLKGHIRLKSKEGEGSSFTLYLPLNLSPNVKAREEQSQKQSNQSPISNAPKVAPKSQSSFSSGKLKKLLIIEDDASFANTLMNLCRKKGYLCRHATSAENGLKILEKDLPNAILLDINLPGINGIEFLDKLKQNKKTANIPVQIISATEENNAVTKKGAIGYLTKPITQEQLDEALDTLKSHLDTDIKNLLIIEDNQDLSQQIQKLIEHKYQDLKINTAFTGTSALSMLKEHDYDCIILDLGLPDMNGLEVIQKYHAYNKNQNPTVIIYTGQDLNAEDTQNLSQYADSIIIKGGEASIERLLQETTVFLEQTSESGKGKTNKPPVKESEKLPTETNFENKNILLVDDDARNVFAIKKILGNLSSQITTANDGKQALDILNKENNFDLVLMDIMMPIMDGYEATEAIRSQDKFKNLPVIALTAKALAGDKQKCLDSGASDYITKPIDMNELLTKVTQWLTKT